MSNKAHDARRSRPSRGRRLSRSPVNSATMPSVRCLHLARRNRSKSITPRPLNRRRRVAGISRGPHAVRVAGPWAVLTFWNPLASLSGRPHRGRPRRPLVQLAAAPYPSPCLEANSRIPWPFSGTRNRSCDTRNGVILKMAAHLSPQICGKPNGTGPLRLHFCNV